MIYGLSSDTLATFMDLLEKTRLMEDLCEEEKSEAKLKETMKKDHCSFCHNVGHIKDECRKLLAFSRISK